jgi:hypothetical protein
MKKLVLSALIAVSMFAMYSAVAAEPTERPAFGADTGDRPIGVEAQDWIPVSEKLGFVVVSTVGSPKANFPNPPQGERALPLLRGVMPPAPAAGYFMVKTSDGWRRLVVMTPADLATAAG